MAVKVLIPTPLRPYAGKSDSVDVDARTVGEALGGLTIKIRRTAQASVHG